MRRTTAKATMRWSGGEGAAHGRVPRGAAALALAGTAAGCGIALGVAALAWRTLAAADWSMWEASDAVLVAAGAVGAAVALRFLVEVAAAAAAIARGAAAPQWTGRAARVTAAALAAVLLGTGAAHAADPPPAVGWLPASAAPAAVPWTPATVTPSPARIVPREERVASAAAAAAPLESVHVVAPGESLWSITAAILDTRDTAVVAEQWPRLYAANRSAIGDDPGLIHPGLRLSLPEGLDGADR